MYLDSYMYHNYSRSQRLWVVILQDGLTCQGSLKKSQQNINELSELIQSYLDLLRCQDSQHCLRFQRLIGIPRCWSLFKLFKTQILTPTNIQFYFFFDPILAKFFDIDRQDFRHPPFPKLSKLSISQNFRSLIYYIKSTRGIFL